MVVTALIVLFLSACGQENSATGDDPPEKVAAVRGERVAASGGSYVRVSPRKLEDEIPKKGLVLVNTHVPFEGDISGTDLSIPYNEIGRSLQRLPAGKDAKIALYCKSGRMSAIAAETLVGRGYTNVIDLRGGMDAWQAAGLPLKGT